MTPEYNSNQNKYSLTLILKFDRIFLYASVTPPCSRKSHLPVRMLTSFHSIHATMAGLVQRPAGTDGHVCHV